MINNSSMIEPLTIETCEYVLAETIQGIRQENLDASINKASIIEVLKTAFYNVDQGVLKVDFFGSDYLKKYATTAFSNVFKDKGIPMMKESLTEYITSLNVKGK